MGVGVFAGTVVDVGVGDGVDVGVSVGVFVGTGVGTAVGSGSSGGKRGQEKRNNIHIPGKRLNKQRERFSIDLPLLILFVIELLYHWYTILSTRL